MRGSGIDGEARWRDCGRWAEQGIVYLRGKSQALDFRHRGKRYVKTLGPFPSRSAARPNSTIRLEQVIVPFLDSLKGNLRVSIITHYEV